jgi:hypothetical protein
MLDMLESVYKKACFDKVLIKHPCNALCHVYAFILSMVGGRWVNPS